MAHFAQLDEKNVVTQVIVVNNETILDSDGVESEAVGVAFCQSLFGGDTRWLQTSYSGRIRKNYAGIGFVYDANRDAFIPPRPFLSWGLDEQSCQWKPPAPYPSDGQVYEWNEGQLSWIAIQST